MILAVIFIYRSASVSTVLTHGFASYYTFSKIFSGGEDLSKAYDSGFFSLKMEEYGFGNIKDVANNLPTSAFLYLPVSWLPPAPAKAVWIALSVIFLFLSVFILFKTFDIPPTGNTGLLLLVITLLFYPLYNNIALGQAYIFLLLLFSINLYGLKKNNVWLITAPLVLILMLKGYGIVPVIFLLFAKRYREFFLTVGFAVVIFLITLPILHWETWTAYFNSIFVNLGGNASAASTAYQTVNSLVRHLFTFDDVWSPYPVLALPNAAVSLLIIIIGLILITFFLRNSSRINVLNLFALSIGLNVVLAPLAEEYHYILFIPLIFMTALTLSNNYKDHLKNIPFAVILFLLLALPLPYKTLQDSAFPVYLLAYPKLFAGIVILFLSLKLNQIKESK